MGEIKIPIKQPLFQVCELNAFPWQGKSEPKVEHGTAFSRILRRKESFLMPVEDSTVTPTELYLSRVTAESGVLLLFG